MTAVLQEMQTHGVPISQHHPFCMYHDIVCALSGYIAPELQDMRVRRTLASFLSPRTTYPPGSWY